MSTSCMVLLGILSCASAGLKLASDATTRTPASTSRRVALAYMHFLLLLGGTVARRPGPCVSGLRPAADMSEKETPVSGLCRNILVKVQPEHVARPWGLVETGRKRGGPGG